MNIVWPPCHQWAGAVLWLTVHSVAIAVDAELEPQAVVGMREEELMTLPCLRKSLPAGSLAELAKLGMGHAQPDMIVASRSAAETLLIAARHACV